MNAASKHRSAPVQGQPRVSGLAQAQGYATVNMQEPSGRVRTYWVPEPADGTPIGKIARQPAGRDWLGCLQADEWALGLQGAARAR